MGKGILYKEYNGGILSRGILPGGFCLGGFCSMGDFVQGDFVLEPTFVMLPAVLKCQHKKIP